MSKQTEITEGRYVEFMYHGFRLGRICKIKGNIITVVLAPYKFRGKRKGKKVRIKRAEIKGILWRKKVIKL